MKKGMLIVSIFLLLAAGVAVAYGLGNFSSAAREGALMDQTMASIQSTQDMAKMQGLRDDLEIYSGAYRRYRQGGIIGMSGAALLLAGSVVSLLKGRTSKKA